MPHPRASQLTDRHVWAAEVPVGPPRSTDATCLREQPLVTMLRPATAFDRPGPCSARNSGPSRSPRARGRRPRVACRACRVAASRAARSPDARAPIRRWSAGSEPRAGLFGNSLTVPGAFLTSLTSKTSRRTRVTRRRPSGSVVDRAGLSVPGAGPDRTVWKFLSLPPRGLLPAPKWPWGLGPLCSEGTQTGVASEGKEVAPPVAVLGHHRPSWHLPESLFSLSLPLVSTLASHF